MPRWCKCGAPVIFSGWFVSVPFVPLTGQINTYPSPSTELVETTPLPHHRSAVGSGPDLLSITSYNEVPFAAGRADRREVCGPGPRCVDGVVGESRMARQDAGSACCFQRLKPSLPLTLVGCSGTRGPRLRRRGWAGSRPLKTTARRWIPAPTSASVRRR